MPLYRPTELIAWLESIGATPKKGLSQNFLIDGNIIRRIVSAGEVAAGDGVLEIGSGPGALTEALLKAGADVVAVERDSTFAEQLKRLDPSGVQLRVCCDDILKCQLSTVCAPILNHQPSLKVLANLPYHITTPILIELIEAQLPITHIVVMVQEEVARRMTALPGSQAYGSLSLFLRFYTTPTYICQVSKRCFYPVPKVDSAVVLLRPQANLPAVNRTQFFKLTRQAFGQRRKTLRAALKDLYPSTVVIEALERMHCNASSRAEELSLEQFLELYKLLRHRVASAPVKDDPSNYRNQNTCP